MYLRQAELLAITFDDHKEIFRFNFSLPDKKRALANLARLAKSFEEWRTVLTLARANDENNLIQRAIIEMFLRATTTDDWFHILQT